jgi:hypothetical protein
MILEILQHVMLCTGHDGLVFKETVEELLKLGAASRQESVCLRSKSLFRGEIRDLVKDIHRETLFNERLEGSHA